MRHKLLILGLLLLTGCHNNTPDPVAVVIKSPAPGATVKGVVPVKFDYNDEHIKVNTVDVRLDGVNVAESVYKAQEVYSLDWKSTTAQNGNHALTVVVIDDGWRKHESAKQAVTVAN